MMNYTKGVDSMLKLVFMDKGNQLFHLDCFAMCNVSPGSEDLFSLGDNKVVHDVFSHEFNLISMHSFTLVLITL